MAKKVAFIIAHEGYQPVEYQIPKRIIQKAGIDIITASNKAGTAKAKDGSTTQVDSTVDKLNPLDYNALIFIGGSGAMEHLDNDISYHKIQQAVMAGILVAGICIAPRIMAKAGALAGKRATGWNGDGQLEKVWQEHAVIMDEGPVVTDKLVITATGPAVADLFAHAILQVI